MIKTKGMRRLYATVFFCFALSLCLLFGLFLRAALQATENFMNNFFSFFLISLHGLVLFALIQPQKRRKLMALAIVLRAVLLWIVYGFWVESVIYAVMSYPINLYADAILVAYLLSTKRGPVFRVVMSFVLSVRIVDLLLHLFLKFDMSGLMIGTILVSREDELCWLIIGGLAILLEYSALLLLIPLLKLPKNTGKNTLPILNENFLSAVERENSNRICIECGRKMVLEGERCMICGKAQDESVPDIFADVRMEANTQEAYDKLAEGDWSGAATRCEAAAAAGEKETFVHIARMLADLKLRSFRELIERPVRLELQEAWQQAVNSSDGELKPKLVRLRRIMFNLYEDNQLRQGYVSAAKLSASENLEDVLASAKAFARLGEYGDAPERAYHSLSVASEMIYEKGKALEAQRHWDEAAELYRQIPQHSEVAKRLRFCKKAMLNESSAFSAFTFGGKLALILLGIFGMLTAYFTLWL